MHRNENEQIASGAMQHIQASAGTAAGALAFSRVAKAGSIARLHNDRTNFSIRERHNETTSNGSRYFCSESNQTVVVRTIRRSVAQQQGGTHLTDHCRQIKVIRENLQSAISKHRKSTWLEPRDNGYSLYFYPGSCCAIMRCDFNVTSTICSRR